MGKVKHAKVLSTPHNPNYPISTNEWNAEHVVEGTFPPDVHGNESHNATFITGQEVPSYETDPSIDPSLKGITLAQVRDHSPKSHTHVESDIIDLSHNAQKIKGKEVDDSNIGDGKVLGYNAATGKIEYKTVSSGGMQVHGNEYHDPDFISEEVDPTVDSTLKGITLTQVRDHAPKIHGNEAHNPAFAEATHNHDSVYALISHNHDSVYAPISKGVTNGDNHDHYGGDGAQIDHANLANKGVYTHAQIDAHINNMDNPHNVTKTQVGLGNVTNDAQLKRAAGDFNSFPLKATPSSNDILLIEDSADSYNKKKITIGSLPSGGGGSVPSGTVILLYNDETDSTEVTNSTSETQLKSWTLPANSYSKIIIEAEVRARVEQDANAKCDFTFRIYEGSTVKKTIIERIIASSTTGIDSGGRNVLPVKTVIAGGQSSNTLLKLTGQMSLANAATGMLAHSFRVYGVV